MKILEYDLLQMECHKLHVNLSDSDELQRFLNMIYYIKCNKENKKY